MLSPVPPKMKCQKSSKPSTSRGFVVLLPTLLALVAISSEMNIPPRNIKDMLVPNSIIKEELNFVAPQVSESSTPLRELSGSSEIHASKSDFKEGNFFSRESSTPTGEVIDKDHQGSILEKNKLTLELENLRKERSLLISNFAIASTESGLPLEAEKLQIFPKDLANYETKAQESLEKNDLEACKKYLQSAQEKQKDFQEELAEYSKDIQASMTEGTEIYDSWLFDINDTKKNKFKSALEELARERELFKEDYAVTATEYGYPTKAEDVSTLPFNMEKLERHAIRSLKHNNLDSCEKYLQLANKQQWDWMQKLYDENNERKLLKLREFNLGDANSKEKLKN